MNRYVAEVIKCLKEHPDHWRLYFAAKRWLEAAYRPLFDDT